VTKKKCQCDQNLRDAVKELLDYAEHVDGDHPGSIPVPMRMVKAIREAIR
jgi:hypothetical protein